MPKKNKKKSKSKATQPQAQAQAQLDFVACETFDGARPAFEFKSGEKGVGYSRSDPAYAAALTASKAGAAAAAGPAGAGAAAAWSPAAVGLPTREEQAKWKPLEWERFKEERRQYWGRLKHPMLRKSASGRGLYDGGEVAQLRDRMLKSDLGMGLTDEDRNGPPAAAAPAAAPVAGPAGQAAAATGEDETPAAAAEPYVPHPGEQCYTAGCQHACDVTKECPVCKKRGMRTFFCSNECFKGNFKLHKKLHKCEDLTALDTIQGWGLARCMAAEILLSTDIGSITAVAAMANTDELVAIMALRKNDFDVGQAVMHLSGRDSDKRMDMPTQQQSMDRILERMQ